MTPDVATQIKNESAVDVSVVNVCVVNVIVLNVSVGEDKIKTLRQKRFCACLAPRAKYQTQPTEEPSDTATGQWGPRRPMLSHAQQVTEADYCHLAAHLTQDCTDW